MRESNFGSMWIFVASRIVCIMKSQEVTKVGDVFTVKWDDPDAGPEESEVQAKDMKYPPIPFEKLEVGQKLEIALIH